MKIDEVIQYILCANSTKIQDLIVTVMRRYKELSPDWELIYYARMKNEPVDMEKIVKLIGENQVI